jgi:glycosyltransferase involved in cell wall biosynthesis
MKKPIASFIIPAFGRSQLLTETLQSVINQTQHNWEVLVIDDGSNPPLRIPSQFKRYPIQLIRKNKNAGPAAARNLGFSKAKGDFICFLDSDDLLHPDFLEKMLLASNQETTAVLCLSQPLFEKKYPITKKILQSLINFTRNSVLRILFLTNHHRLEESVFFAVTLSRMIFPAQTLKKVRFNEQMINCEDWDFILHYLDSHPVVILPQSLVQFRFSNQSFTEIGRGQTKWRSYDTLIQRVSHKKPWHPLIFAFRLYKWIFSTFLK